MSAAQKVTTTDLAEAAAKALPGEEPIPESMDRPIRDAGGAVHGEQHFLANEEVGRFRAQWSDLQARFVDEPRESARRADELVAKALQRIAEAFSQEKQQLEGEWSRGGEVSTEDLRQAIRRYRAFFDRLLSV
jgi:hypothetical protein